jgi:aminopeptidase-like protein
MSTGTAYAPPGMTTTLTSAPKRGMIDLITDLSKLRLGVVTPDMPECTKILQRELAFQEYLYPSGHQHNGWIVPDSWHVQKATIHNAAGELIYDGTKHLLGVCTYSNSFIAGIGGEELKKHLYFAANYDDALIYHCDWVYKPHKRDWGFSVTKQFYNSIGDRDAFHVELRTVFAPGHMRSLVASAVPAHINDSEGVGYDDKEVLHVGRPGGSEFIFAAHDCHPSLCNDDLSGIAVGVEVMKRLPKDHRHTYRLVVMPEHYGTIFLLSDPRAGYLRNAKGGLFLEAYGTQGALALQRSFTGVALIDRAVRNVISGGFVPPTLEGVGPYGDWYEKPFRGVAGNDETVMEAPGIEIPFASLTRYPFKEYHTSHDTPALMDPVKLEEAVEAVLATIDILENDCVMGRTCPDGLVCLSNPKYDLYQATWDPSIPGRNSRETVGTKVIKMNNLMDCFPRYLDGKTTCLQIAERFSLPFAAVRDYIRKWELKGLLKTSPAPIDNTGPRSIAPW